MVRLSIGNADRELFSRSDIDESWINREINGRRSDGMKPCVKVLITANDCNIALSTPGCPTGLGGGRLANSCEREFIELWAKLGMNDSRFTGGNLIAFLKQFFNKN